MGDWSIIPENFHNVFSLSFEEDLTIQFDTLPMPAPQYTIRGCNASHCDKDGNLQFWSEGRKIYNIDGEVMENGDSINHDGVFWESSFNGGYGARNAMITVPDPVAPDSIVMVIHAFLKLGMASVGLPIYLGHLVYSRVDMHANGGKGKVLDKNNIYAEGVFFPPSLTRHANGRDWWIVTHTLYSDSAYIFLLSPEGISEPFIQKFGPTFPKKNDYGYSVFSMDGRYYARQYFQTGLVLYQFDRCAGMFVDYRFLPYDTPLLINGTAEKMIFSPSGQYLYLITNDKCQQVDTWASELKRDTIELIELDKPNCKLSRGLAHFAPDGKIYVAPSSTSRCLHIIEEPDKKASECKFTLNALQLPYYNQSSLLHSPNFRLGALEGSPCDTLGSVSIVDPDEDSGAGFRLYPNPATAQVTLELDRWLSHDRNIQVRILSVTGQLMYEGTLPAFAYIHTIPLAAFTPGLYFTQVLDHNGQILGVEKLVVE
jgi:hypothetical protein